MRRMNLGHTRSLALAAGLCIASTGALAASADDGKRAFMRAGCWQCHGTMGQGAMTGPKLAPDPLPFEALSSFVRSSNRNMPAYRVQVLSDQDLGDIYAYLQSIPKAADPKSIPLLNP
jgi:ubiquinol-cytochrome c reductase cytochrome c subunit